MSPRTASVNQDIRDKRQEQIVQAGLKVFARKGPTATKISDIASAAGISQGLIHHYFTSKESLYAWVAERAIRGGLRIDNESLDSTATPWNRLESMCEAVLQRMAKSPEYLLVVVQCLVNEDIPPEIREPLEKYGRSVFSDLVQLIREGQAAKQVVPGNPEELALIFLATIQGLVLTQFTRRLFVDETRDQQPDRISPSAETVLRLLKA